MDKCLNCKTRFKQHKVDYRLPDSFENHHNHGLCPDCSWEENKRLVGFFKSRREPTRLENCSTINISDETKQKIREYLCENLGVLFQRKNQCYRFVNEEFGLNLTRKEVETITYIHHMKKHGFVYKHKRMSRGSAKNNAIQKALANA